MVIKRCQSSPNGIRGKAGGIQPYSNAQALNAMGIDNLVPAKGNNHHGSACHKTFLHRVVASMRDYPPHAL